MREVYDLIVVGGGSAGLSAVGFGAAMGASVLLVEKHRVGGDCTWTGCVPSKALLKTAKVAHHMRYAERYGVTSVEPKVDLATVMSHMRGIIAGTYKEEAPEVLEERGIDVLLGAARFLDPRTLLVGEKRVVARNILLVTGAHPLIPPISGLEDVEYLDYENVWELEVLPRRLLVVGAGPIGCELAQAFSRLGTRVTLVASRDRILPRDEPEASRVLADEFQSEGIDVRFRTRAERVWQDSGGIHLLVGDEELVADALLVSAGRRPNVEGLDLERAGVDYSPRGIEVDDRLRTTQRHIYAAGDCIGGFQFTHYAGWQATMGARNALLPGTSKGIREWVPWTTFTDPEVAHAGLTEAEAREKYGDSVQTTEWPMEKVDRAREEVDTSGLIKLVHKKSGTVLGVTIVCERASELLQEWMLVLEGKAKARDIYSVMHVYPGYAMANFKASGALLQKQLLGGRLGKVIFGMGHLMLRWMRWTRGS